MSDEVLTLEREYREAHGAMRFGWTGRKIIKREHTHIQELRSVFMWQQKDGDIWYWMVQFESTKSDSPTKTRSYTIWGNEIYGFRKAEDWLECKLTLEMEN